MGPETQTANTGNASMEIKNRIMVVDDSANERKALAMALKEFSTDIMLAKSAETAEALLGKTLPDLILLDVVMPGKDGFEFCRDIKSQKRTRDIPVIFLTGLGRSENIVKGFDVGGDDYLLKPIAKEELMVRVRNHLKIFNLQKSLKKKNHDLGQALKQIKTLEGLLPICSDCKKIRDEKGRWRVMERYIQTHSKAKFSHGICPECADRIYGSENWYKK